MKYYIACTDGGLMHLDREKIIYNHKRVAEFDTYKDASEIDLLDDEYIITANSAEEAMIKSKLKS